MPLQLNNESEAFLITDPINIRGKGVILITVGHEAFISWVRERRDEDKENKALTWAAVVWFLANFRKLLNSSLLKGQTKTFSTNLIWGEQELEISLVCFNLIWYLLCVSSFGESQVKG